MGKRRQNRATHRQTLVESVKWVWARFYDEEEKAVFPNGQTRSLWRWARREENQDEFVKRFVPLAIKEESRFGTRDATLMAEERSVEELEKRVRGLMSGERQVFCERCWAELSEGADGGGLVEVVHE